jgi:SSS family solute:Na+ symporter
MSTLSSLFHVTGSSIGHDFFRTVTNARHDNLMVTKIGMIFGIILSIIFAMILPPGVVARGTAIFFGICAAAFLPAYFSALYWKGATKAGVWASIATGTVSSIIGLVFLHRKESASLGICQALFGKSELISTHPWPFVDPFIYSLPLAAIVLVAVSLFSEKLPKNHISRCFKRK